MTEFAAENDFSTLFAPESTRNSETIYPDRLTWKILLVDDEADIRSVLKLALQDTEIEGRTLHLLDADSATQAKLILADHPDIALILLDVVMENEQAGLSLVRYIRKQLANRLVQIVLVTGQPGYAPQRDVVIDYEINGYRLKSELTTNKIFTSVCTALRTYKAFHELECQRQTLEMHMEKLRLAAGVFTHAREGIMITGADATIIDVNHAFTLITGYAPEEVIGRNPRMLNSGYQDKAFYVAMWRALKEKGHWYGEIWNKRKNGDIYAEILTISSICDAQGNIQQYVGLFSDITNIKQHEKDLEHIAHYDALTSLPNRVLLADRLRQGMISAHRRNQIVAVAYLDLDGFKEINDNHGHEAGDQVLITLSSRMQQCLRESDTLARLGGDEFIIVLVDLDDTKTSEPLLVRLLAMASQPVQVGNLSLRVSASIGVTFYPQLEDVDADQLLRQADHAMYQAKLTGKNRYNFYDAQQDSELRDFHESIERIRSALEDGEFVLYYQPKVNMRTGTVLGVEALIRWTHPTKGLLPPAFFLPMVENHPLIVEIGEWVIESVLIQMEQWQAAGLDISVSVNVAARQLQLSDFELRLRKLLSGHPKIIPERLEIEILETSALEDIARISGIIETCRVSGVMFTLDDFGTGYSSLTYLKRLAVKTIKIDQSFVRGMLDDIDNLSILDGVLNLAAALGREVIAEGVETIEHGLLLLQLGCECAQGFGISRPMPADDFPGWINEWSPDSRWVNQPPVNRVNLPLLFASVEHRALIRATEAILRDEHESFQRLRSSEYFGRWLDGKRLDGDGDDPLLKSLESIHDRFLSLVTELSGIQENDDRRKALSRLNELYELADAFLEQIKVISVNGE